MYPALLAFSQMFLSSASSYPSAYTLVLINTLLDKQVYVEQVVFVFATLSILGSKPHTSS